MITCAKLKGALPGIDAVVVKSVAKEYSCRPVVDATALLMMTPLLEEETDTGDIPEKETGVITLLLACHIP
jgi:hypothetical protein